MKRWLCALLSILVLLMAMPMATLSAAAVTYGDVNTDGKINNKDLSRLQQHLNEWDVDADTTAADVNDDGKVNNKDLGLLQQYLNEWDVTLGPEETTITILAVGDSYALDVMERYLYPMLKSAGIDRVHLGVLYADQSNVATTYEAVNADSKTYQFRQNTDGNWTTQNKVAPSTAFKAADWDYVILQQGAVEAGQSTTYGKLNKLTALVQKQCENASILWHMGWAFRRQSDLEGFENYKYNEKVMFEAIVENTLKYVMRNNEIMSILPTATTIQNLRTSTLRDQLTTDGVRLTDYGAYAAALTWYARLMDASATTVTYRPDAVKEHFAELAEAADNAIAVPNEVTSTTEGEGELKDLKILSIGHSFSLDAMRTYMWDAFDAAGYNVTIGYLYYPSCSLEQHYHYISENSASYEQYGKNTNGKWETRTNVAALDALYDEEWDIVTFQPDPDYGHGSGCYCQWGCNATIDSDYAHFNELVDMVKTKLAAKGNTDVKFYYHLTWTWRADCYLYNSVSRGYDQQTLWQAFIDATHQYVTPNENILGVIPCNTAIQNARTTWMGDTFNAEGSNDGYHLSDKGDLVAALTWVSYFTGVKASKIYVDCSYTDAEYAAFAEAVDNAIANPEQVTQSSYPTQP